MWCLGPGVGAKNVDMAELDVQEDSVVSAALSHAAAIRRTLWMQEYKRKHGRTLPSSESAKSPTGVGGHDPLKAEETPLVLDGPIYSTEYWRAWKSRSRAGIRAGRPNNSHHVSDATWGIFFLSSEASRYRPPSHL